MSILVDSSSQVALFILGALAFGLGGCDSAKPLEMRCAAMFYQLSNVHVGGGLAPSQRDPYRAHALAFIDRLPGDRDDNLAAMRGIGGSIMADDGLRDQCDGIIPFPTQGPRSA